MACVALALGVLLSACARAETRTATSTAAAVARTPLPLESPLRTVQAPRFSSRQWSLQGSFSLKDYTADAALLVRNTHRADPEGELFLLDLSTGKATRLLARPLERRLGLQFTGYELSEDVVAWEECSPYDLERPTTTSWRLYACRYEAGRLVGKPRLLDWSDRGQKIRPLFKVSGTTVIWLNGAELMADAGRGAGVKMGVHTFDVATGRSREVTSTTQKRLCLLAVDGPRLALSSFDATRGVLEVGVGRWDAPAWEPTLTTLPAAIPSHSPIEHDGLFAFATGTSDSGEADLFMRSRDAGITRLADSADNPVFAGDYLFWRKSETNKGVEYAGVEGMRLGSGGRFTLVREDISENGWWRTSLGQPYLPHTLVIANDRTGWGQGEHKDTLVRVYRF